jgi:hypothetical protein
MSSEGSGSQPVGEKERYLWSAKIPSDVKRRPFPADNRDAIRQEPALMRFGDRRVADACGRSPEHSAVLVPVSQAQGGMRASSIVKSNEFSKGQPQVPLVEGDEIVQALPSNSPDQSFAEGIGDRRLLHLKVTLRRDVSG